MRRAAAALLMMLCAAAGAQQRLPQLEPLPEPPPPPPLPAGAESDEPRVQIPVQKGDRVEPVRRNGVVVAVKVTTPGGLTYYLVDTTGNGNWMRRESLEDGLAVPMFPIFIFD